MLRKDNSWRRGTCVPRLKRFVRVGTTESSSPNADRVSAITIWWWICAHSPSCEPLRLWFLMPRTRFSFPAQERAKMENRSKVEGSPNSSQFYRELQLPQG